MSDESGRGTLLTAGRADCNDDALIAGKIAHCASGDPPAEVGDDAVSTPSFHHRRNG